MRRPSARHAVRLATALTAVVGLLLTSLVGTAQAHHGKPGWDEVFWNHIPVAHSSNSDARAVTVWENRDGRRTTRAQVRFYANPFSGGYLRVLDSFSDNRTAYGQIEIYRNGGWEYRDSLFTTASDKDKKPAVSLLPGTYVRVRACVSKRGQHRVLDPNSCASWAYGYYDR